ncbi:hypothetical protein ACQEVZ_24685 [Dactylosporangium sp. CA-152071]|uniref:hypothetical protein n=1 Tax=Dactylosporangium sp. CA-152071 TaxID=3239933 RepID=UPI003D8B2E6A
MTAAAVEPIVARIPIFMTRADRRNQSTADRAHASIAGFVVDPAQPDLLSISCPSFLLRLDRAGVKRGMAEPWTDPDGQVTVSTHVSGGARWLVVDLDVPSLPTAQVHTQLDRVANFLTMADALLGFASDRFAAEVAAWMGATPGPTTAGPTPPEVTG